jgi:hypothetical protein
VVSHFFGTGEGCPAFLPPANPDFYGGDRLDLLFGVNLIGQKGAICGHRLAAEFGFPVYQDLNGPQLETDYTFTLGWQKALSDC